MEMRVNARCEVEGLVEGTWQVLNEELVKDLKEGLKAKYQTMKKTADTFKSIFPSGLAESKEGQAMMPQFYNGLITVVQAGVGVGGVLIATPLALLAGLVSETSQALIDVLESAKIKS